MQFNIDDRVIFLMGMIMGGLGGFILGATVTLLIWKHKILPPKD